MKILKILLLSIPCAFIQFGCSNESTSDLIDDTLQEEVTYTNTIKSIVDNNCVVCHSTIPVNGAPMSLVTYENVKDAVLNRGLLERISREQGASGMMPLGGNRLPQATIDKVSQWLLNNTAE